MTLTDFNFPFFPVSAPETGAVVVMGNAAPFRRGRMPRPSMEAYLPDNQSGNGCADNRVYHVSSIFRVPRNKGGNVGRHEDNEVPTYKAPYSFMDRLFHKFLPSVSFSASSAPRAKYLFSSERKPNITKNCRAGDKICQQEAL